MESAAVHGYVWCVVVFEASLTYRAWAEMYTAYKQNRMDKNPADFWYNGELGFFDNYIIPLAKKLKDCNVFGVSSDECLNFAIQNRLEWEARGQEVVAVMTEEAEQLAEVPVSTSESSTHEI